MSLTPQLQSLIERQDLEPQAMAEAVRFIMSGQAEPAQVGAFLLALRVKRESVAEIAAAARVMREHAKPVHLPEHLMPGLVDLCGTGGDGQHTFNISTAAMFVAAAAGAKIAKHGGRAVSSSTGSADVLEALGVRLDLTAEQVGRCIEALGIGFMFAPNHHPAMRFVAPVRKALGVRTIFNILGPLTNPAGALHQLMGVFSPELVRTQAEVLRELGSRHVLVVHARNGLDEIALDGETFLAELTPEGDIHERLVFAQQYGVPAYNEEDLQKGLGARTLAEAQARLLEALDDQPGPARDIVVMNAGAALWASDRATSLADGVRQARAALSSGAARQRLRDLIDFTHAC